MHTRTRTHTPLRVQTRVYCVLAYHGPGRLRKRNLITQLGCHTLHFPRARYLKKRDVPSAAALTGRPLAPSVGEKVNTAHGRHSHHVHRASRPARRQGPSHVSQDGGKLVRNRWPQGAGEPGRWRPSPSPGHEGGLRKVWVKCMGHGVGGLPRGSSNPQAHGSAGGAPSQANQDTQLTSRPQKTATAQTPQAVRG